MSVGDLLLAKIGYLYRIAGIQLKNENIWQWWTCNQTFLGNSRSNPNFCQKDLSFPEPGLEIFEAKCCRFSKLNSWWGFNEFLIFLRVFLLKLVWIPRSASARPKASELGSADPNPPRIENPAGFCLNALLKALLTRPFWFMPLGARLPWELTAS